MIWVNIFEWISHSELNCKNNFSKIQKEYDVKNTFPFKNNKHEISIIKSLSGNYSIAIMIHNDSLTDDSVQVFKAINEWLKECQVDYQHSETQRGRGFNINEHFNHEFDIIKKIGNL